MPVTASKRCGLQTFVLSNPHAEVEVCPSRGGLVTRFKSGPDEVLYLDEATFADFGKNVRGGVPILFPIAGPPPPGSKLAQHGFARSTAWEAEPLAERVRLTLRPDAATRAVFPHEFRVDYDIELVGGRLELRLQIFNVSDTPMPLCFGLHPYFAVPLATKEKARIETHATRAWDNVKKALGPVPPLDLGGPELDAHLLDHGSHSTTLHRGDGTALQLEWSKTLETLVVWTQPGKPFVCVEPWSGPSEPARAALAADRAELPPHGATSIAFTVGG